MMTSTIRDAICADLTELVGSLDKIDASRNPSVSHGRIHP